MSSQSSSHPSFHQILLEKMNENAVPHHKTEPLSSEERYFYSPAEINFFTFKAQTKAKIYQSVPLKVKKIEPESKPEKTLLISQMTDLQKNALKSLVQLGASELKDIDILGETKLKKAFRRLAKMLHPDHHKASNEHFIELKAAYNTLSAAL